MNPLDYLPPDMRALLMKEAQAELLKQQAKAVPAKAKKLTPKQELRQRAQKWVNGFRWREHRRFERVHADEIAEIQKEMPGWQLTPPGTSDE